MTHSLTAQDFESGDRLVLNNQEGQIVVLFKSNYCAACQELTTALNNIGAEYVTFDVDDNEYDLPRIRVAAQRSGIPLDYVPSLFMFINGELAAVYNKDAISEVDLVAFFNQEPIKATKKSMKVVKAGKGTKKIRLCKI